MNPLNTLEKAQKWAHRQSKIYNGKKSFMVCRSGAGYIVQPTSFIIQHIKEYKSPNSFLYCTNEDDLENILIKYFSK